MALPEDLDRAYAEALAQGAPEAGRLGRLLEFRRALFRRDLEEAKRLLPPDEDMLSRFLQDLEAGKIEPWLEAGPGFVRAEAWVRKGAALAEAGKLEAAREAFERAQTLFPKHPRVYVNLGNLALEEGRVEEAIALYEEALKLDPELADAHHNLAAAYKKKGDLDRMVRHLKRAQRLRLYPPRESLGRRGGVPPVYARFWFWFLLAALAYILLSGRG